MLYKSRFISLAVCVALGLIPVSATAAPPQQPKTARVTYHFRSQDKSELQPHYLAAHPDAANGPRWNWHRGENLPSGWQGQIQRLAAADIALLVPPPPRGYEFGYYQGWAIVYDPQTGEVLDAVSLM